MTDVADGTYTAVVDRIEDDLAVILLEDDEDIVGELIVDEDELPRGARHADAILQVTLMDDEVVNIDYRREETKSRQEHAQSRFDRLSRRPPRGDEDS